VKVIDFGIAKAVKAVQGQDTIDLTDSGTIIGSPSYMSPEQVRNKTDLDARTDIYALACVVYKMLTGLVPFRGSTAVEVATHHVATAPPPISALTSRPLPPGLDGFLLRALSKKPEARPSDALAFARLLREAVVDRSATAPTLPDPSQGQDPIKPTELMSVVPPSRLPGYQPPAAPTKAPSGSAAKVAPAPAKAAAWSQEERRRAWLLGALLVAGLALFAGMAGLVGQQLWAKHRAGQDGAAFAGTSPGLEDAHEASKPAHEALDDGPSAQAEPAPDAGGAPTGEEAGEAPPSEGSAVGGALGASSKKGEGAPAAKKPSASEVLGGKEAAPSSGLAGASPGADKPAEASKPAEGKPALGEASKHKGELHDVRILLSSCDEVEAIEVGGRRTFCGAKLRLHEGPHTVTLRHKGKTVMRSIHVRADKTNYPLSLP
jgi:serine/threonine-protein kinase